jgi:hypothetical protein
LTSQALFQKLRLVIITIIPEFWKKKVILWCQKGHYFSYELVGDLRRLTLIMPVFGGFAMT